MSTTGSAQRTSRALATLRDRAPQTLNPTHDPTLDPREEDR